jgi:hypothetical protein
VKITARGGTDGATMVLYWPDNLPDDADTQLKDDPMALIEKLRDEGKLILFPCDGDGQYTLAVFVGGQVSDELQEFCKEEERYPSLIVRGDGYFGGAEYMFKHNDTLRIAFPHMSEKVVMPAGTYAARVWRTNVPESVYHTWLVREAGPGAKRLRDLHRGIATCAVVGVLLALVTLLFVPWAVWFCIAGAAIALVVVAVALSRTPAYQAVAKAQRHYEEAFPKYVVHLE